MDFSLREWLLVIGVVLIVGVLLDGYRRARVRKRGSLKLAIDKNLRFRDEDRIDYFHGELPSGSVRVVRRSSEDAESAEGIAEDIAAESATERAKDSDTAAGRDDPGFFPGDRDLRPDPLFAEEPAAVDVEAALAEPEVEPVPAFDPEPEKVEKKVAAASSAPQEVEEVIVINAFSPEGSGFKGDELMGVILACGMRFGDMNIFHRSEQDGGSGNIQFSMANAVKPGFFELDAMDHFTTPGVSFFMSLPGPSHSMQAFDYMLETAQCLVKNLGGELRDEQHSTLTGQTIEHARQKIRDFERRQLSLLQ